MDYIKAIETNLQKKAEINFLPLQQGDLQNTYANIKDLEKVFDYQPKYNIETGVKKFVDWFVNYYKIKL